MWIFRVYYVHCVEIQAKYRPQACLEGCESVNIMQNGHDISCMSSTALDLFIAFPKSLLALCFCALKYNLQHLKWGMYSNNHKAPTAHC